MNETIKRAIPFAKEFLESTLEYRNDEEYTVLLKKVEEIEKNPNVEITRQDAQDILDIAIEAIEINWPDVLYGDEKMLKERNEFVDEWNHLEWLKEKEQEFITQKVKNYGF